MYIYITRVGRVSSGAALCFSSMAFSLPFWLCNRARRSSDSLFNGDLGSPMSPAAAQRSASGNSISLASPSDVMSLTSSKARASPGTQVLAAVQALQGIPISM